MKELVNFSIIFIILFISFSCNTKEEITPVPDPCLLDFPIWQTLQSLMEKTEENISNSNWEELNSLSKEISIDFLIIHETLKKIETTTEDYISILKLQSDLCKAVSEVFNNNLADIDNLNKLLTVDDKMFFTKKTVQKYKEKLFPGFFFDLSTDGKTSDYLLTWSSRLIKNFQNKILTEKEIETEEDIKAIKLIIDKAEEDKKLDKLQSFLEIEANKEKVPSTILFSLSMVYLRKGLVTEEYKTLERLEEKVKQQPKIAFILSLVYGRKETLKSQIEKIEAWDRFVLVRGGTFQMGSKSGKDHEKPIHSVTVSSFYMGKYEITVGDFRIFVNESGYKTTAEKGAEKFIWTGSKWEFKSDANWLNPYIYQTDNDPVTCVSLYDAVEYCNWLSEKEGLTPSYNGKGENLRCNFDTNGYRLPTEAEWEFAARGGNSSLGYTYSGSNIVANVAWYKENSLGRTHPVGTKKENELGLYDMSGNLSEWCWDTYGSYSSASQSDPTSNSPGTSCVICGGGWYFLASTCRSTHRGTDDPFDWLNFNGFRLVQRP